MDKQKENYRGILIVEDEPVLSELAIMMLNESGYKNIAYAGNGKQALERLDELREGNGIDVIVTDVMMPNFDATYMFRKLAENDRVNDYGYVIMTGFARGEQVEYIKSLLGQERFNMIGKPFRMEDLLQNVEKALDDYDMLHAD